MTRTFADLASMRGRTVLIVGGAGHIGSAIATALEEVSARVAIADLPASFVDRVPSSSRIALPVDIARADECAALPDRAVEALGRLDVIVHAFAAFVGTSSMPGWAEPFDRQTVEAWNAALAVNTTSAFIIAQAARAHLEASGNGAIVLVSSIYGSVAPDFALYAGTAMQNPAGYGVSKAGLRQLARYLATALAPSVRVNVLSPGGVARGQPDEFVTRYEQRTPLRRMATEEDFKGAAVFLASDLSRYVTGQELLVDGGWTAW